MIHWIYSQTGEPFIYFYATLLTQSNVINVRCESNNKKKRREIPFHQRRPLNTNFIEMRRMSSPIQRTSTFEFIIQNEIEIE